MVTHFIDNKIVDDILINIFINISLPSSTKYMYHVLQQSLKLNVNLVKMHHEYAPITSSVNDVSTESRMSDQNLYELIKRCVENTKRM